MKKVLNDTLLGGAGMISDETNREFHYTVLKASWLDTPLGAMITIADDLGLYLLEFMDRRGLEREIERIRLKATILPGSAIPVLSIEEELELYFSGNLTAFKTLLHLLDTLFQKHVWEELIRISYGETRSYAA